MLLTDARPSDEFGRRCRVAPTTFTDFTCGNDDGGLILRKFCVGGEQDADSGWDFRSL